MAARPIQADRGRRRIARAGVGLTALAVLVATVGPARAGLLATGAGITVLVVRLLRLEGPVSRPQQRSAVPVRPEVWTRPVAPPATSHTPRAEAHRAYAHALHAVTAAYLAECEREVQR